MTTDRSTGRVALIAGGASVIGRTTVLRLANEGVTVVVADVQDELAAVIAFFAVIATIAAIAAIAFLASDDASFVTGAEFVVDGGYVARRPRRGRERTAGDGLRDARGSAVQNP